MSSSFDGLLIGFVYGVLAFPAIYLVLCLAARLWLSWERQQFIRSLKK